MEKWGGDIVANINIDNYLNRLKVGDVVSVRAIGSEGTYRYGTPILQEKSVKGSVAGVGSDGFSVAFHEFVRGHDSPIHSDVSIPKGYCWNIFIGEMEGFEIQAKDRNKKIGW